MKVVFMGTADFGADALRMLVNEGHDVVAVVTKPPRPKGRGRKLMESPIHAHARDLGIDPILTPEKLRDPSLIERLRAFKADLFVVVAYRILPPEVFTIPRFGTVNIHASLLPAYRGAAPIQRAIEAGERRTGITIFKIDEGVDTGGILLQVSTPIGDSETTPQLYERLKPLGAEALKQVPALLSEGATQFREQNDTNASPAPKLLKEEGRINWGETAEAIYNKIRAFKPFPGTYTMLENRRMHIDWAVPIPGRHHQTPGIVSAVETQYFDIACGGGYLRVERIKPEGKRTMTVEEFVRGTELPVGTKLV